MEIPGNNNGKLSARPGVGSTFGTNTVRLTRSIGVGRTSVVYEGKHNNASVAVKMAKKADYLSCIRTEIDALQNLSELGSPHIPKILFKMITHL